MAIRSAVFEQFCHIVLTMVSRPLIKRISPPNLLLKSWRSGSRSLYKTLKYPLVPISGDFEKKQDLENPKRTFQGMDYFSDIGS